MEKDRSRRYQTAEAMRSDLEHLSGRLNARVGRSNLVLGAALLSALFLAGGLAYWRVSNTPEKRGSIAPVPEPRTLAVLPLQNLTGDDSQEYLTDGMTEALISSLAQVNALRVISRDSVMRYKGTNKSPAEISKELKVDTLVAGSVVRSGDFITIETKIVRLPNGQPVWVRTYQRNIHDIETLQNEMTLAITSAVQDEMALRARIPVIAEPEVDPEAYELYLRGRYCWNKRTEQGYYKAIQFFRKAIAVQPDYAKAYAGLADSFAMLGDLDNRRPSRVEMISKARSNVQRALQLDDNLAEAHASLASISYVYDWDWPLAEKEFHRALELNPNYATAHHWYAYYCLSRNRIDEGLSEIRLAQTLDPQSLIIQNDVGQLLYMARRYDDAIEEERRTLEMDESLAWPHFWLGLSFLAKGQNAAAIAEMQSVVHLSGEDPSSMAMLGIVYARTGHIDQARRQLQKIREFPKAQYDSLADVAFLLAALGQEEEAFAWLSRIFPNRPRPFKSLHLLPYLDPLRSDPRFRDLQARVGLP